MSSDELTSVLCCPLKKPLGTPDQQWGGYLARGVAWIELTARRARELKQKIEAIRKLENEEILENGRWRGPVPTFRVFELPEPNSHSRDRTLQEVMSTMKLRDTPTQGFARLRPSELPPGLPTSSALQEGLVMDHPQQLAVDSGAVIWEVQVGRGCWYHTMAVQDWWLENIARKHEVYTSAPEKQNTLFRQLAQQSPKQALAVLEGAGQVWRASREKTHLLSGLESQDLSYLLAQIKPQYRGRLIRAIGQLPLTTSRLDPNIAETDAQKR